jgi:hypothetical protein
MVVLDTLADHDGRAPDLALGLRDFARLTTAQRAHVRRLRHRRWISRVLLVPTLGVLFIVSTLPESVGAIVLIIVMPAALAALGWVYLRSVRGEQRLVGRRRRRFSGRASLGDQEQRLANAWLAQYRGGWNTTATTPTSPLRHRMARIAAAGFSMVLAVVVVLLATMELGVLAAQSRWNREVTRFSRMERWQRVDARSYRRPRTCSGALCFGAAMSEPTSLWA